MAQHLYGEMPGANSPKEEGADHLTVGRPHEDCRTQYAPPDPDNGQMGVAEQKLKATLAARLALVGFELLALERGGFIVCRWGRCRMLPTLAAVQSFADQLPGGRDA